VTSATGTEGYAEEAESLIRQYESFSFADVHGPELYLIPPAPCRALDVGSGTGRDAAALAAMGHSVVAVEPTGAFRLRAPLLHPSPHIEWLDDSLPDLVRVRERGEQFDLVMLTAVWMHLDDKQRQQAMPNVASLIRTGGVMILSLRHGPIPRGRRMFAVAAEETIESANGEGLQLLLRCLRPPLLRSGAIAWTHLAFAKPSD
jgi:SAM-dependent methyltransferase